MPRLSGRSGNVAVGDERPLLDLIEFGLRPVVPICQCLWLGLSWDCFSAAWKCGFKQTTGTKPVDPVLVRTSRV
ncbi:hypothetical protein SLA2020_376790 [Shorea laevis]